MKHKTEFYLGCHIDGPPFAVTVEPFCRFLSCSVTPRFSGFTVADGQGYWQGKPEPVRVLTIIHDGTTQEQEDLEDIAAEYKDRFSQGCVLVVDSDVQGRLV